LKIQKADYSQIAKQYDKLRPPPSDVWVSKITQYGAIDSNSVVLDVGCGTGRFPLRIFALKKPLICGLEPSIEMLKNAVLKDDAEKILWVRGDAHRLPFNDSCFDCVYMTLVVHHLKNKELALREIYRALRKGGTCVVMTNSHTRMKRGILRDFPGLVAIDLRRFPPVPSIKRMMVEAGFKNVHYHVVNHDEGYMSTGEYIERVRRKFISTLTLLSEEKFRKGFKVFCKKARKRHGKQFRRITGFDFVVGQKIP